MASKTPLNPTFRGSAGALLTNFPAGRLEGGSRHDQLLVGGPRDIEEVQELRL